MSAPWMPLYVADYIADTAHLTTVEHGAYLLLIMSYWRQGGLPLEDSRLARIVRLTEAEWLGIRETITQLFGDNWSHKRIDAEIARSVEKAKKASLAGKRSAEVRGNPHNSTNVEHPFNGRSSDAELSQPQSQSLEDIDANASLDIPDALESVKLIRDRKKRSEELSALNLLGNDWNSLASDCGLAGITEIKPGSKRERHALARIRDCADMACAFTKIRGSPFLLGKSGDFIVTFDWIVVHDNLTKVLEGNYNREVRKAPSYASQQHR